MHICRGASPRPISKFITSESDGINWIKIGDVSDSDIYINYTKEKITKEGADKSRYVHPGDFILSNSMSFGRPYLVNIDGCVHDGWLILSNYEGMYNDLFLYYLLRSDNVQSQFNGSASGAVVKNLNSDIVRKVKIIQPPIELQNEFAEFVQLIDKSKLIELIKNNSINYLHINNILFTYNDIIIRVKNNSKIPMRESNMSEKSKNNIDNMNESLYFKIINKARLEIAKCILNLLRKDHNTINSTQLSKDSTSSVFLKYRFETKHQIYSVRDNANKVEDIDSNDILILLHFGNTKNQFEDSSKVINVIVDNKYNNEAGTFFYLKRDFENNKLSKDLNTIKFPLNDNNFDSNEEYKNQIFYKYVPFYYLKNKDNKINDCDSENPEEKKNDNNDKEKNNESNEILKYQKVINDRVFNSLKSKEVYIPNPYQLNDLYDCTNLLMMFYIMLKQKLKSTELKEELEGLYSKISDENDFDIYDKDAVYNKFLSLSTSYSQELQNQIKNLETSFSKLNSFYIFSLTTTSSNSLMWAHYANANNGLCFGYKGEDIIKLINNIKEYAFVFFNPVNYQNKPTTRQIISKIEYFYKYDIKDKLSFLILSFFKNSIWNYENEYRIVIDIKDFDKFEHEYELKFNHKFDHKYPLSPSEIIFGPGWRKDEISSFLNEHKDINKLQKMDKFYASISKEDYKININEYTD